MAVFEATLTEETPELPMHISSGAFGISEAPMMLENGLDVRGVITHRFAADQFRNGLAAMLSTSSGKVVLDWAKPG
jgi:threonine dehydrogenase-like Zn-dependent dehydrogenase